MAIQLVINGYFRSGTSIVWKALKEANPKISVFYEPCNGDLLKHIDQTKNNHEENKLHGMFLWDEYLYDIELLDKIRLTHPNPGQTFPNSISDFEKYIDVYNQSDKTSILQSNRWHFFLHHISERTGCKIIHIIRNPFNVFNSTISRHLSTKGMLKCTLEKALMPLINGKIFELDQMFQYLYNKYERTITPMYGKQWWQKIRWSMFEKFVFVWTISNFEAIEQVKKTGGTILIYELMEKDPSYGTKIFEKYSLGFDENLIRINSNSDFISNVEISQFMKSAKKVGVDEEFSLILKHLALMS